MGKSSVRAEQDDLRDRMRSAGMTYGEIATEFARRYRLRPRAAFRHAHGWTLQRASDRINANAADLGIDQDGRASMTAPLLCELEHWPYPDRRRPTPRILAQLAAVYGTDVHSLLDIDDRERIPAADRLIIETTRYAGKTTVDWKPESSGVRHGGRAGHMSSSSPRSAYSSSSKFGRKSADLNMTSLASHIREAEENFIRDDFPASLVEWAALAERADAVANELRWILGYLAKLAKRAELERQH